MTTREKFKKDVALLREKVILLLDDHMVESINAVGLALVQSSYEDLSIKNKKMILKFITEWIYKESKKFKGSQK
jgi:hypothetical protein